MVSNLKGVFSHESDEWKTPSKLYKQLNEEFKFTLDPCSTDENAKCDKHYTIRDNGLEKSWGGRECSVIRRILKLKNGLQNAFMKQGTIIR